MVPVSPDDQHGLLILMVFHCLFSHLLSDKDNKLKPVLPDNQHGLLIPVVFHCWFSHFLSDNDNKLTINWFLFYLTTNMLYWPQWSLLGFTSFINDNKLKPVLPDNKHGLLIPVVFHCLFSHLLSDNDNKLVPVFTLQSTWFTDPSGLFVWFGLNVTFNTLSVILQWCLDVAGSSMLTFRVLPHWNIMP